MFSGIGDLANLVCKDEMRFCDGLGLTLKNGWGSALSNNKKGSPGKGTMGELSDILLRKDRELLHEDCNEKKPLVEKRLNLTKNSIDPEKEAPIKQPKQIIKRVRI
jgi:hypothetical protein